MARLIDPVIARAVARRLAGDQALRRSYLLERLERNLAVAVPRAEELVAEASGIPAPEAVSWRIIDRATWAEVNIAGLQNLLGPLGDRVVQRMDALPWPVRVTQRSLVSIEVGVLLGYVSRRVLGQYDLLVAEGTTSGTPLYFVGPNMVETERRLSLVPEEFALWVALHEVTHRFQFEGVAWLRERFFSLVESYLSTVDIDAGRLTKRLAGAVRRLVSKSTPAGQRNPIYLLASDEQREVLNDMQALMAVVEGHGNYVMDAVGARHIPSFQRMRRLFQARRAQTNLVQRAVNSVIGLEMKMRQYELGQAFCDHVASKAGAGALAKLWAAPESLPSLAELSEPDLWLRRVA